MLNFQLAELPVHIHSMSTRSSNSSSKDHIIHQLWICWKVPKRPNCLTYDRLKLPLLKYISTRELRGLVRLGNRKYSKEDRTRDLLLLAPPGLKFLSRPLELSLQILPFSNYCGKLDNHQRQDHQSKNALLPSKWDMASPAAEHMGPGGT